MDDIPFYNFILSKLSRIISTQCENSLELAINSWQCYELVCALVKAIKINDAVYIWSDLSPTIKDSIGLPQSDTGIDYIDEKCSFAGQAKFYQDGGYVKAYDIDRSRLCMYRAKSCCKEAIMTNGCEISTPENVTLGKSKIKMDDVYHNIVTRKQMKYWCKKAMSETNPTINSVDITEPELRDCQIGALNNIKKGRINRIKLACGSGKSRIAKEVIMRDNGQYLILVPFITLLEQWSDYLKQFDIDVIMIGTGYKGKKLGKLDRSKKTVIVCVYDSYEEAFWYKDEDGDTCERKFKWTVVDEAHHIASKENGRNGEIWAAVQEQQSVLLLSASLESSNDIDDNSDLSLHYNYSLRDAIDDDICSDYDITVSFFTQDPTMHAIAKHLQNNPKYLSILAYCNKIESARELKHRCGDLGITAAALSCENTKKERNKIIKQFERGEIRVLCLVNTIGEGIDLVNADTCLFAEPRGSEISITQCVGRVVRKAKGKNMAHVIVCTSIDAEENISKHPTVKILRALANDDTVIKKMLSKKTGSSRLAYEIIKDDNESSNDLNKRSEWIRDEIYKKTMKSVLRGDWMSKFEELRDFYKEHDYLPSQKYPLGSWLHMQRERQRGRKNYKSLSKKQLDLMNSTFGDWLVTFQSVAAWYKNFEKVRIFYEENNKLPDKSEPKLSGWINSQRCSVRNEEYRKTLNKQQITLLNETFPGWLRYNGSKEVWYDNFQQVKKFYKENNRLPKGSDGNIGRWLQTQRGLVRMTAKGKPLTANQVNDLNSDFPEWLVTTGSDADWHKSFEQVNEFYKGKGRLPTNNEGKLGSWLKLQRCKVRNPGKYSLKPLSKEKIELLSTTYPKWLSK